MLRLSTPFLLIFLTLRIAGAQDLNAPARAPLSAPAITPANYNGRQIFVGSGGGVTGASTTYHLLDNGLLFGRRSRDSVYTPMGKQTTANTKRVFAVAEGVCKVKTTRFNNPGNTYRFVGWKTRKQANRVTWGEPGTPPPARYLDFYNSFMAMIPASSRLN